MFKKVIDHLFNGENTVIENIQVEKEKEWTEKVAGLIPVEISSNSDAIIHHMLVDWSNSAKDWCNEYCIGNFIFGHFSYNGPYVYFEFESDAMAFRLKWANK